MEEQNEAVNSPQNENFSEVSTNDLRDALGTEALEQIESPETSEIQSESEPLGEVSLDPEVQEQPSEAAQTPEEAERLAKRRIRPRNELDQQVIDLYRSEGFNGSFAEASDVIYGRNSTTQAEIPPQQYQEVQPTPDPYVEGVETIRSEISELEQKVEQANEELDTAEALKLQREIFRKELEISKLDGEKSRAEEYQQMQAQETQRRKALESRERAIQVYPELNDPNTVYRKQFDHFISQSEQNPDFAVIFNSPNWPEVMANQFAAMVGRTAQQAPQAPQIQPQQQVAPTMGNQAKVLTTGQTAQPANQPVTAENVLENMHNLSNDQIYGILGQPDGRTFVR